MLFTVVQMPKFNPFRPNSIVTAGMFCGRWDEMRSIEQGLFQTKHGNPKHFIVQGERGIGKSSLLFAVDFAARGELENNEGIKFNFVVISIELVGASTYENVIDSIAAEFKAELGRRQQVKQFATKAWDFISNWKVMGVEYKKDSAKADDILLVDSLCEGIATFFGQSRRRCRWRSHPYRRSG
jgi:Cdc6-like AAA superfamily ATPase